MESPEKLASVAPETQARSEADDVLVSQAQKGGLAAFEELVSRHQRRVYRTLLGITGNHEEAEDGGQNAFLKAYLHLGDFQGAARFSTWLLRIAINEGLERLRRRRNLESLDVEDSESEEGFRPRQIQAWEDNPEQLYAKTEMRRIVEQEIMKLPPKYRVVVMLRDVEELSTEETAEALGLGIPAVKTRLLRGRLMLREALAPRFLRRSAPASVPMQPEGGHA